MTANPTAAARIADLIAQTTHRQSAAANPAASVWVSANAGTGKTHVLTQRVLRLLLTGTPPERILCLTYTKAAAAEMSKRVFDTLAGWVGLDDSELTGTLAKLLGTKPTFTECALARTLFTRAIETPGGFKVQTIHAFCERLLQRFPLEAGVAPGFSILDDHTAGTLIGDAINDTLREATHDRQSLIGLALTTAIRYAADDQFDTVLTDAIKNRTLLDALIRRPDAANDDDPLTFAGDLLRSTLSVRQFAQADGICADMADVLDEPTLQRLRDALSASAKPTDAKAHAKIKLAALSTGQQRIDALADFFLTGERDLRKSLMTKDVKTASPDLDETATEAQWQFAKLDEERRALDVVNATIALYRLADAVLSRYQSAKTARAALDFEDLIVRTANLLSVMDTSAAWVLYKLDGGLDHILVDEAQDTAPAQWQVIERIAAEFFNDSGAGSKAGTRTVFAVGDEKQSIYSFQGAAPEMFAKKGQDFKSLAEHVGMPWVPTALTLSFRTVGPILEAVDHVFADAAITPGVSRASTSTSAIEHACKRMGHAGLVELWPTELPDEKTAHDAWSPLAETGTTSPVTRLADRIATTIRGWIENGEMLASEGRPIRAGDILILVRRREPFASAIVAALKAMKVDVAGADRITLADQIGVQDLLALGDFLTLPEDDLSLACVLKSPLFGLDDDDLQAIAYGRKGILWKALLDAGLTLPRFMNAATTLKRWRKEADFMPPFEFYSAVLDQGGLGEKSGRMKLLERLGPQAADSLDEFLNLALTYDDQAPPSLTGFLSWLRADDRQIKRDMEQGRNEVRVLTVHGSKGLEAPIVFLPDTCSTKSGGSANGLLMLADTDRPSGTPQLAIWPVKGAASLPAVKAASEAVKARETEELHRLLYVALTRPRDRLYICGFQTREKLTEGCWYDIVAQALNTKLTTIDLPDGTTVQRLATHQTAAIEQRSAHTGGHGPAAPRPAWMDTPAPREVQPSIPVAPSRLAPYDFDDAGEPISHKTVVTGLAAEPAITRELSPPTRGPRLGERNRFLRGTLTHALLEHLPSLPQHAWPNAIAGYLETRGADLSHAVRASIQVETLAILHHPTFAPLFAPSSRAEVPIVAELANPKGKGPPLKLNGQIDRLVVLETEVLIVDYKTNRPPPTHLIQVPEAYLVQLAAYHLALSGIFPGKTIRAALLWTQTPNLMEIPSATLNVYGSKLWELGTRPLDGIGLPT